MLTRNRELRKGDIRWIDRHKDRQTDRLKIKEGWIIEIKKDIKKVRIIQLMIYKEAMRTEIKQHSND